MSLRERCLALLDAFPSARVAGFGDLILDDYRRGRATGLSPEAPAVELLNPGRSEAAGGAANVATNIGALGGQVTMVGVIGRDAEGAHLASLLRARPGIALHMVEDAGRPTTLKLRYYADQFQVLRVSQESREPLAPATADRCRAAIEAALAAGASVLFVEDYGKGAVCPPLVDFLVALRRSRPELPLLLDPKVGNHHHYRAGLCTLLKPNWQEACMLVGEEPDRADRAAVARRLAEAYDCDVLITLGQDGIFLHEQGTGRPFHVPTRAREAFDIAGAGDTTLAALALTFAAGGSLLEAAVIANAAGGVVVEKSGTASVSAAEVRAELRHPATEEFLARLPLSLAARSAR